MAEGGGAIEILELEAFGREELLDALRATRLKGHDQVQVYAEATLELATVETAELAPAQRYMLSPNVARILALRQALARHGHDVFALDGGLWVRTAAAPEERIPVIPPVVERSTERDGGQVWLVNDGIHRVFAARRLGRPINVVRIDGVPAEYPYYAYALADGWAGVTEMAELPDGFQKKEYREPTGYKALFREFNDVFPGVQKERKDSNPDFLSA